MMKKTFFKSILIIFVSACIVATVQLVRFSVQANSNSQINKYTQLSELPDAVGAMTKLYHKTVNDYFNYKIAAIMKIGASGKDEDLVRLSVALTPPPLEFGSDGLPTKRKSCPSASGAGGESENLSTYCASSDLTREYLQFRAAMIEQRTLALSQAQQRFETLSDVRPQEGVPVFEQTRIFGGADMKEGQKKLQDYGQILNKIDEELDMARKSLDQGLAAYNELQMALPMHVKFQKVIHVLEDYRDKLSSVRQQIELYPATFVDVTTPSCS